MKSRASTAIHLVFIFFIFLSVSLPGTAYTQANLQLAAEALKKASDEERKKILEGLSDADKQEVMKYLNGEKKDGTAPGQGAPPSPPAQGPPPSPPGQGAPPSAPGQGPAPSPLGLSEIEKIMSGEFPTGISRELKQFGYDFFRADISTFAPVQNVPVGPDYILGPGDTFTIHLWGKVEATYNVTVSRDGTITIPRVGALQVGGQTMDQCASLLLKKFREYYTDFQMDISMGSLRTVDLFVVGEARNPGSYNVSSLSTVITALYAAGGPSKKGSLRKISLLRNGNVVKVLDLYDFLINGNKSGDVRVQPGDTIHIPVLGPVVGVAGFVKRPAIYEMKSRQTLREVISTAGGILPLTHLQNVVIERLQDHKRRVVRSFNLDPSQGQSDKNMEMLIEDGDVVKIYPVHQEMRQVIRLEGHVKYPREYEFKPGMKVRDIIASYEELLPEPYLEKAEVSRLVPPDLHPETVFFNLGALLNGDETQNLPLQDRDRITIYDKWEKSEKPEVTIRGAVRNPGPYKLYRNMTIKDLIFKAGNLTDRAFGEEATLTRIVPGEKGTGTDTVRILFSPANSIAGSKKDDLLLQKDDVIDIRLIPMYGQALARKVTLAGEFMFPGDYSFKEGERLQSAIQRAGGLTPAAYPFGAVFTRESVKEVQNEQIRGYISKLEEDVLTLTAQSIEATLGADEAAIMKQTLIAKKMLIEKLKSAKSTGRMVINLEEVMVLASSQYNFELRPGDQLTVAKRPDSVNVLGEVYNPTALVYDKGRSVDYYVNMVGGPTDSAEQGQIYVVKANGSVLSKSQEKFFGIASWDSKMSRWTVGGFGSMKLDDGDTVIVPKQIEKYPWLRIVKDVTQIAYQIAVAAGVIIVAF